MKQPLSQTWRLALSYLTIIMLLSLVFSALIFAIITAQLDRPLPPPNRQKSSQFQPEPADMQARIDQRNRETRRSVLISLASLNAVMLLGGTALSYYLARRTLAPIESAMATQQQFVSDASHELRTPLTALLASNEVALRKKELTSARAREVLRQNIAEINRLNALSENLLGLAKAEHALATVAPFSLGETVGTVVRQLAPLAQSKHIQLQVAVPGREMTANAAAVRQIATILLDNALKYSPTGSTVHIASQVKHQSVILTIRDEGPGIGPTEQAKIFERFYRADTARTRSGASGHGLGLAIAKTVADRNGYGLQVESKLDDGALFSLSIPI